MSAEFLLLGPDLKRDALLRFRLAGFFLSLHGELEKSGRLLFSGGPALVGVCQRPREVPQARERSEVGAFISLSRAYFFVGYSA
jgi:hypothetical protein